MTYMLMLRMKIIQGKAVLDLKGSHTGSNVFNLAPEGQNVSTQHKTHTHFSLGPIAIAYMMAN